ALWNLTPAVPAHALVIPKSHVEELAELNATEAQGFLYAISETFRNIQRLYVLNPQHLLTFYNEILTKPPAFFGDYPRTFSEKINETLPSMLSHEEVSVSPTSYNIGMNCGYQAGQRIAHLHMHLFPRREAGPGVVTAMRHHLSADEHKG
ncbi:MAG: HIT domain-containing protein, partial [Verrucomicrobia bacterium]|nr:HIT domain-containing protein [Verrucomicrobiota bacterium]